MKNYIGKKVIVRGIQSGVYFGTLIRQEGNETELKDARNIWYWSGANNLLDMAENGIKNLSASKISNTVGSIVLLDACEIVPCSQTAAECIEGAKAWI